MAKIEKWTDKAERFYNEDPNREKRVKDYLFINIILNLVLSISMLLLIFVPTQLNRVYYSRGGQGYEISSSFSLILEGITSGDNVIEYIYPLFMAVLSFGLFLILLLQFIKAIREYFNLQTVKNEIFLYLQGLVKFSSSPSTGGKVVAFAITWNVVCLLYDAIQTFIPFFIEEIFPPVGMIISFVAFLGAIISGIVMVLNRKRKMKAMLNEICVLEMYKEEEKK